MKNIEQEFSVGLYWRTKANRHVCKAIYYAAEIYKKRNLATAKTWATKICRQSGLLILPKNADITGLNWTKNFCFIS